MRMIGQDKLEREREREREREMFFFFFHKVAEKGSRRQERKIIEKKRKERKRGSCIERNENSKFYAQEQGRIEFHYKPLHLCAYFSLSLCSKNGNTSLSLSLSLTHTHMQVKQ